MGFNSKGSFSPPQLAHCVRTGTEEAAGSAFAYCRDLREFCEVVYSTYIYSFVPRGAECKKAKPEPRRGEWNRFWRARTARHTISRRSFYHGSDSRADDPYLDKNPIIPHNGHVARADASGINATVMAQRGINFLAERWGYIAFFFKLESEESTFFHQLDYASQNRYQKNIQRVLNCHFINQIKKCAIYDKSSVVIKCIYVILEYRKINVFYDFFDWSYFLAFLLGI